MSDMHEMETGDYAPRSFPDLETFRLLESRRDALLERAERLSAERRLLVCLENCRSLGESLEAAESRSRALESRVEELERVTSEIFASRRWRLWNLLRYGRRAMRSE
jgi:hypothetical protein